MHAVKPTKTTGFLMCCGRLAAPVCEQQKHRPSPLRYRQARISAEFDTAWRVKLNLALAVTADFFDALLPDSSFLFAFSQRLQSEKTGAIHPLWTVRGRAASGPACRLNK